MIALTIALMLLAVLFGGSIESQLHEAFSNPDWMMGVTWEEEQLIFEDNSEWSWGHNIKNYIEEEL